MADRRQRSSEPSDRAIVCANYTGPSLDPVEITYDVTVDDDVTDGQVLTNSAVHVTDNPGSQPVTVSAEVTVSYSVTDGHYTRPGPDYEPLDDEITFAAGETTATEVVGVIDRRGPSPRPRFVEVTIEPGDGYEVGDPATARVDIVSDGRPGA